MDDRWKVKGFTVTITGLPGSHKTTFMEELARVMPVHWVMSRAGEHAIRVYKEEIMEKERESQMPTLDEHNEQKYRDYGLTDQRPAWNKSGVTCPKCGAELIEQAGVVLASNPPKKNVECVAEYDKVLCGYRGYKVI